MSGVGPGMQRDLARAHVVHARGPLFLFVFALPIPTPVPTPVPAEAVDGCWYWPIVSLMILEGLFFVLLPFSPLLLF